MKNKLAKILICKNNVEATYMWTLDNHDAGYDCRVAEVLARDLNQFFSSYGMGMFASVKEVEET